MTLVLTDPRVLIMILLALSTLQPKTATAPYTNTPRVQMCDAVSINLYAHEGDILHGLCVSATATSQYVGLRLRDTATNQVRELHGSAEQITAALRALYPRGLYLAEGDDLEIPNALPNMPEVSEYWTDSDLLGSAADCGKNLYYVIAMYFQNQDQFKFCIKSAIAQSEVVTRALERLWKAGKQIALRVGGGYYLLEPGAIPNQQAIEALLKNPQFVRAAYEVLVEMSHGVARDPKTIQIIWSIAPWDAFR